MDEALLCCLAFLIGMVWRHFWIHSPKPNGCAKRLPMVGPVTWCHLIFLASSCVILEAVRDVLLHDVYDVLWHDVMASGEGPYSKMREKAGLVGQLVMTMALIAPFAGMGGVVVVGHFFYTERAWFDFRRESEQDLRQKRRRADLVALGVTMPMFLLALTTKGELHLLAKVLESTDMAKKYPLLEVNACKADLQLALASQYLWVYAFISFCRDTVKREDPDYISRTLRIPCLKKQRVDIGNAELLALRTYIVLGVLACILNFAMVANPAEYLSWAMDTRQEASGVLTWLANQLLPVQEVFTAIVFVASNLLLEHKAIGKNVKDAGLQFSATRWLLLAPLQRVALRYLFTMGRALNQALETHSFDVKLLKKATEEEKDMSLLMHVALLSIESVYVVLYSKQQARLADTDAPLLKGDNLEEASAEAVAGN